MCMPRKALKDSKRQTKTHHHHQESRAILGMTGMSEQSNFCSTFQSHHHNVDVPKNKHQARMNYKGTKKPVKAKQPKNVANAESKIKDHVKYYKNMQKKSNYQDVFSKEP